MPRFRVPIVVAVAAAAVLLPAGAAWAAVTATVHTSSGSSVNVRSGPHTSDAAVGSVADGASISVDCQAHGDTVTGRYGTTDLWDHIASGYLSAAYVDAGGASVPACDSTPPPDGDLAARILTIAQQQMGDDSRNHEIGGYNCNYYTTALGEPGTGDSCSNGWHTEEWCADFTKWVWGQAGADTSGSDPSAISFRTYGQDHGTWHTSGPKKADAIVFENHVGIVVSATSSDVTYISGNTTNPSTGNIDAIAQKTISLSGTGILGYSSPVA
ncbi:hypothetical protein [Actinocatenispora rupis]|uniref:SH3 domain-containing protein n=1 Tax=Actinocatenispora rupis TaxID=519421 RepID=A0A8J3NAK2_9ACTN|nr:hypothetical protein [Actinocatenispora rupis]GID09785.1 hypothetical protein Aru02nite_06740 [Actinocatenispora rupis]